MPVAETLRDTYRALRQQRHWIACEGYSNRLSARAVLAEARQRVAGGKPLRYYGPNDHAVSGTFQIGRDTVRHFPDPEAVGLRKVGYADEIAGGRYIDNRGWFADAYASNVYRGVVYRAPGKDGHARLLAGYEDKDGDGVVLTARIDDTLDTREGGYYTTASDWDYREVAASADKIAEIAAREAREYDQAWTAGNRWAQNRESLETIRRDRRRYQAAARQHRPDSTCARAMAKLIAQCREAGKDLHDENVKLQNGDWYLRDLNLSFYPNDEMIAAFCDGADIPRTEYNRHAK